MMNPIKTGKIRFLVTGANGFIGQALCDVLLQHGHDVRGAVRHSGVVLSSGVTRVVVGEINNQTDWSAVLADVDIIIHLAARVHVMHESSQDTLGEFRRTNVAGTEHMASSAAASGVQRMVFVSSVKVNGEETLPGHYFNEFDIPMPRDPYGISKWEAEQALHRVERETNLEIVIVRPPLVYGVGVKGNFAQMLKVLAKGIPLPLASVTNLRSLVYIGNFVDALEKCAIHPAAAGNIFLVSDGEDVSTPELLRQLGKAMGHPARLLSCSPELLKFAGRLFGKSTKIERLVGSLQVDSSKLRHELNWHPPFTMQQGLKATAESYKVCHY